MPLTIIPPAVYLGIVGGMTGYFNSIEQFANLYIAFLSMTLVAQSYVVVANLEVVLI
jgi:hypothetical protein